MSTAATCTSTSTSPSPTPKATNALVCTEPGHFAYEDRPAPVPAAGQALLRIKRIGICGTDLHTYQGAQPFFDSPHVLGHELAGEFVDTGGAAGFAGGEAVTFIPYFNCGHCMACRTSKPNCCVQMQVCGVHVDGGMTELLAVPAARSGTAHKSPAR